MECWKTLKIINVVIYSDYFNYFSRVLLWSHKRHGAHLSSLTMF